jgi:hypothetical protein
MKNNDTYAIGKTGVKWGPVEQAQWLAAQNVKRSYADDVLSQLDALGSQFDVKEYAHLDYASGSFPLFALSSLTWDQSACMVRYVLLQQQRRIITIGLIF